MCFYVNSHVLKSEAGDFVTFNQGYSTQHMYYPKENSLKILDNAFSMTRVLFFGQDYCCCYRANSSLETFMKYLKKYWEKATARYILESLKGLKSIQSQYCVACCVFSTLWHPYRDGPYHLDKNYSTLTTRQIASVMNHS